MAATYRKRDLADVPKDLLSQAYDVKISEHRACFRTGRSKELSVFYRDSAPSGGNNKKPALLLLHGMRFKSQTWQELGTIQLAAAMGYRVVAVDLPGYGESAEVKFGGDTGQFIADFCACVGVCKPIVVSPSMSGSYALPYIMGTSPRTAADRASACVTMAPITTEKYSPEKYKECKIPAMILYGSNDKNMGVFSTANLSALPNGLVYEMANAGHACYMDKPDEWHRVLYNFLCILGGSC